LSLRDWGLGPLSKPLSYKERGFEVGSPSLAGNGLGVRSVLELKKLSTAIVVLSAPNNKVVTNTATTT